MAGSLGVYMFLGLFVGLSAYVSSRNGHSSIFATATILHSVTFFVVGIQIVSGAGDLLFNTNEADVLAHRPVSPKALVRAKARVMVRVATWAAIAINLTGVLVGALAAHGNIVFIFAHTFTIFLEALFATASVVVLYALGMRIVGRARVDRVVTGLQVLVSIAFVLASQMSRELIDLLSHASGDVGVGNGWMVAFPPAWFASMDAVLTGNGTRTFYFLSAIGLGATIFVSWLAFNKLAATYASGVQAMAEIGDRVSARSPANKGKSKPVRLASVADIFPLRQWLKHPVERAAFSLTLAYVLRDRETKLRIIPGVAPLIAMPFIFVVRIGRMSTESTLTIFPIAFMGLMIALVPTLALEALRYSQNPEAAEIFRRAPTFGPAPIIEGARKAVMLIFGLPTALASIVMIEFMGSTSAALILLPGLIALPAMSYAVSMTVGVPFSDPIDAQRSARAALKVLGPMMLMMVGAGLVAIAWHYGLFYPFLGIEVLVSIVAIAALRSLAQRRRWPIRD
jgi:ABC-2 type transport system permease protein